MAPALTPVDHPGHAAPSAGPSSGSGARPPLFTREGGSGPEEALGRVLEAPVLFLGVALPDDRYPRPERADGDGPVLEGPAGRRASCCSSSGRRRGRSGRRAARRRAAAVPGDAHEWVSLRGSRRGADLGLRRHLPAVGLAVHLRAGLPGRADRARLPSWSRGAAPTGPTSPMTTTSPGSRPPPAPSTADDWQLPRQRPAQGRSRRKPTAPR